MTEPSGAKHTHKQAFAQRDKSQAISDVVSRCMPLYKIMSLCIIWYQVLFHCKCILTQLVEFHYISFCSTLCNSTLVQVSAKRPEYVMSILVILWSLRLYHQLNCFNMESCSHPTLLVPGSHFLIMLLGAVCQAFVLPLLPAKIEASGYSIFSPGCKTVVFTSQVIGVAEPCCVHRAGVCSENGADNLFLLECFFGVGG